MGIAGLIGIFLFFTGILAIVLFPLWRKADALVKPVLIGVLVGVPLLAAFSYTRLGAYVDLQIRDQYQAMLELASRGMEIPEDEWDALVEDIRQRAEKTDGAEYWYLLAGIYEDMQEFELASDSYEKSAETYSEDAGVLARWTEVEFLAQGYNMTPKVQQLSERTLALDPSNATVLGILGISAFQQGESQSAIDFWTRALQTLPPNSQNAQVIQASIMLAQTRIAESGGTLVDTSPDPAVAATSTATSDQEESVGIPLSIRLGQGVDVAADTTLFIIARIPGSPMPTAVTRLSAADLPLELSLDDSMVMIPGTNLMTMPVLEVVARLSFSGQPAAQPGDYEVIQTGIVPSEISQPVELVLADQIQ